MIDAANAGSLQQAASGEVTEPFNALTWRADGETVYIATRKSVYGLARDGSEATELLTVEDPQFVLDVSANGVVAVADGQSTVLLRDLSTGEVLQTLPVDATLTAAHFSPDGDLLAVTIADSILTQLWEVESGAKAQDLTGFETAAPVYAVRFGPDGASLVWYARAKAQVTDLVTGDLGPSVSTEDFLIDPQLTPAGNVLVAGWAQNLTYWDMATGDELDTLQLPESPLALAISPDGKLIAIAGNSGVSLRDTGTDADLGSLPDAGATALVAFAPAGDAIATVSRDGAVAIWAP